MCTCMLPWAGQACRASLSVWPLPPGPDSPVSPLKELKELKEVKELTFAVRKQQRALEERLEGCLEELRALCLREAVSSVARVTPTRGLLGGALESRFGMLA